MHHPAKEEKKEEFMEKKFMGKKMESYTFYFRQLALHFYVLFCKFYSKKRKNILPFTVKNFEI